MILFEEAYDIVINSTVQIHTENCSLPNALGKVLAQDVHSDMNMPPFNKSAMDGYACRTLDMYNELEVVEIIPAGVMPTKTIGPNQAAKIMTGAPVPQGADCVIIVEDTKTLPNRKISYTKQNIESVDVCQTEHISGEIGKNITYLGEDIKTGDLVLKAGTLLKPQHIAVLASVGCPEPLVYKTPKIGIIATGSELVEPHQKPAVSQIRNSNASQLVAQVTASGAIPTYYGIAIDTEPETKTLVEKAVAENDIVLLTGGVSMGDFDLVPDIIKAVGFQIKFNSVAVQPGKPTTFAVSGHKFIFGLPGNPVSSFTQFELLTKPLIRLLSGNEFAPVKMCVPMGKTYSRKKAKRMSWIPIYISDQGKAVPVAYHGSAHINALTKADGIIAVPIGTYELNEGEIVDVRQI